MVDIRQMSYHGFQFAPFNMYFHVCHCFYMTILKQNYLIPSYLFVCNSPQTVDLLDSPCFFFNSEATHVLEWPLYLTKENCEKIMCLIKKRFVSQILF